MAKANRINTLEARAKVLTLLDVNNLPPMLKGGNNAIGRCLREYVSESDHNGWDGFSRQDQSAIWRFLIDLEKYVEIDQTENGRMPYETQRY